MSFKKNPIVRNAKGTGLGGHWPFVQTQWTPSVLIVRMDQGTEMQLGGPLGGQGLTRKSTLRWRKGWGGSPVWPSGRRSQDLMVVSLLEYPVPGVEFHACQTQEEALARHQHANLTWENFTWTYWAEPVGCMWPVLLRCRNRPEVGSQSLDIEEQSLLLECAAQSDWKPEVFISMTFILPLGTGQIESMGLGPHCTLCTCSLCSHCWAAPFQRTPVTLSSVVSVFC